MLPGPKSGMSGMAKLDWLAGRWWPRPCFGCGGTGGAAAVAEGGAPGRRARGPDGFRGSPEGCADGCGTNRVEAAPPSAKERLSKRCTSACAHK